MTEGEKRNYRRIGGEYEQKAAEFLQSKGMKIMKQNYRCHIGEIDLIARDGDTLVFVEVKYRASMKYGTSEMAVNSTKQHTIYRVAQYYMLENAIPENVLCRFDVIGFQGEAIRYFPNAFGGI